MVQNVQYSSFPNPVSESAIQIELVTQIIQPNLINESSKILHRIGNPLERSSFVTVKRDQLKISKLLEVSLDQRDNSILY